MIDEVNIVGKANIRSSESGTRFFIPRARLSFAKLRQTFIKALILYHFDAKCHIWIEINISGYIINRVLSQSTLNSLG